MKMQLKVPQECLLNNRIDDYLHAFLKPLELPQKALVQAKFTIRDNFITPNPYMYNIISFVFTMFITITYVYYLKTTYFPRMEFGMSTFIFFLCCFAIIFVFVFLFVHKVFCGDCIIHLIVNIQEARNTIKFYKNNDKDLIMGNWMYITLSFISYFIIDSIENYVEFRFLVIVNDVLFFFYETSLVYAIRVLKLIRKSVNVWREEMKIREKKCLNANSDESKYIINNWNEMEKGFSRLSKAYHAYKKVFSFSVSNN